MSAGDRDTLALAELLNKHSDWMYALHSDFRTTTCVCGALEIGNMLDIEAPLAEEEHRAHLADVLLASDWLREQRAEAWDEGHRTPRRMTVDLTDGNPYRRTTDPYRTTEVRRVSHDPVTR